MKPKKMRVTLVEGYLFQALQERERERERELEMGGGRSIHRNGMREMIDDWERFFNKNAVFFLFGKSLTFVYV